MLKTELYGKFRLGLLLSLAGLLCFSAPLVRAGQADPSQPDPAQAEPGQSAQSDATDPPTSVARISYVDGSVSIQPGGTGDWGSAPLNRPMTIGDKLWTDKDSRAELQTGVVSIHLGSMTALSFLNLDQAITQMRVAEGAINFRVREIREGDVNEVDTPNAVFNVTQAGAFRIDVNENGDSTGVTVIRGEGQVTAGGKTYDLQAGQRGVFDGTDNNVQSTIAQAPPPDGLDQWANDRDLREQDSVSAQYVPPDMPGTADLDDNGTWSEQPDVGPIWYPNDVQPDWAPYSVGYWSYIGPWGWTWVDDEPWGFAPFHYGRWDFYGGRWGWCPGPRIGLAVYGPAFVGFLGGGFGFGGGIGVGWFPLGWGEPYHPWYHYGPRYFERVNIHNTFIRDRGIFRDRNFRDYHYAYAHNSRAVTATSRSGFSRGQMVRRGEFHVTEASLRGARVSNSVGVARSRESAFGAAHARGNVSRPPMSVQNRSVVARTTPSRGASDMRVRTLNTRGLTPGTPRNLAPNAGMDRSPHNRGSLAQQGELSRNRPSSSAGNNIRTQTGGTGRGSSQRISNGTRTWAAQGNSTDRGRAPQGFGSSSAPHNNSVITPRMNRQDRPPWAGSGSSANAGASRSSGNVNRQTYSGGNRSYSQQRNAPSNNRTYAPPTRTYSAPSRGYTPQQRTAPSNNRTYAPPTRTYSAPSRGYTPQQRTAPSSNRSYSPPSRSYSAPNRSYSAPSRSYSAPSRSYSAPSRTYSAPSRTYSAPSRSYGGGGSRSGGGGSRGGGGGRPHR
ncbi:MAG: DUF6600 domain-containing protein [Candidatus Acidiferrum sp.]